MNAAGGRFLLALYSFLVFQSAGTRSVQAEVWLGPLPWLAPPPGKSEWVRSVPDGSGGAIVCWCADGLSSSLWLQRVTASAGIADGWPSGGLPVRTSGDDYMRPELCTDGVGGTIVAWRDSAGYEVRAIRITGQGTVAPGWPDTGLVIRHGFNPSGPSEVQGPVIASDGSGGAIIAWHDGRSPESGVYAQRITGSGIAAPGWPLYGRLVNANAGQDEPAISSDGAGGAIVAWAGRDIYAQRVTSSGGLFWPAAGIPLCTAPGFQAFPRVAPDGSGGAIAAWWDYRSSPDGGTQPQHLAIYAQRVTAAGAISAGWPADGAIVANATGPNDLSGLATDGGSGAIATWRDSNSQLKALKLSGTGIVPAPWPATGIAVCSSPGAQQGRATFPDGAGGAVVAWSDSRSDAGDVYLEHLTSSGGPLWNCLAVIAASGLQWQPTIAWQPDSGAVVAWADRRSPGSGIYAAVVRPDGTVPVLLSLVSAEVDGRCVSLEWFASVIGLTAALYRSEGEGGWVRLGPLTADGTGMIRFRDCTVAAGHRYGYRVVESGTGKDEVLDELWLDVPVAPMLAVSSVRPTPTSAAPLVEFTLPTSAPAAMRLYDATGRLVARRTFTGGHPGRFIVRLDEAASLSPGIYVIRVSQGPGAVSARVVVAR